MKSFAPNENFKYYMYFLEERMNIFWRKNAWEKPPYTKDRILQEHKFTNVYRVLDRSSQYLLDKVIYNGKEYSREDMFWRIVLYKNYNLPATWDALIEGLGDITINTPDEDIIEVLDIVNKFQPVYSNAYMLTCPFMRKESFLTEYGLNLGDRKYVLYLKIFRKDLIERGIMNDCFESKSFEELFNNLRRVLSFGDFLAYQIAQDLCYTNLFNFNENEFCVAGPGTQRGIERCFTIDGKPDYNVIVKWVHENFEKLCEQYGITFLSLPDHLPMVPDLSNCFCETDKYLRGMGIQTEGKEIDGKRIKAVFKENNSKIKFIFPEKWDIKI